MHLLFYSIVPLTEVSSWLWQIDKKYYSKEDARSAQYIFFGDSQFISGIYPELLSSKLGGKKIHLSARPSDQPEGIFISVKEYTHLNKDFIPIIQISPVTVSKNPIPEAQKALYQNFGEFRFELLSDSRLRKYYFKKPDQVLYYSIIQLFPLLKLNPNLGNALRIIPENELTIHQRSLSDLLTMGNFEILQKRKTQNYIVESIINRTKGYWEWGNFNQTMECIPLNKNPELPPGIEKAFQEFRAESLVSYLRIIELVRGNPIYFLYIPFSPAAEEKIGSDKKDSPIRRTLASLKHTYPDLKIIEVPNSVFSATDFRDYTHLNYCGMQKLVDYLALQMQK